MEDHPVDPQTQLRRQLGEHLTLATDLWYRVDRSNATSVSDVPLRTSIVVAVRGGHFCSCRRWKAFSADVNRGEGVEGG